MISRTICAVAGILLFTGCSTAPPLPRVRANHPASPEAIEATPSSLSSTLDINDPVLSTNTPAASTKNMPTKPDNASMKDNAAMKDMPGMKHGGHP